MRPADTCNATAYDDCRAAAAASMRAPGSSPSGEADENVTAITTSVCGAMSSLGACLSRAGCCSEKFAQILDQTVGVMDTVDMNEGAGEDGRRTIMTLAEMCAFTSADSVCPVITIPGS